MLRNGLAFLGGLVICVVGITAVQALGHVLYPPPANLDFADWRAMEAYVAQMPLGAFAMVELSYVVGSLCGGWIAGRFAASHHTLIAAVLGAIFTGANVWNLMQIPHPLLFAVLTMITFVPCSLLGARVARR